MVPVTRGLFFTTCTSILGENQKVHVSCVCVCGGGGEGQGLRANTYSIGIKFD